jgi:putative resolvase
VRPQSGAEGLCTPAEVARWAKAGKLTCVRTPGGHRRYKASEVGALRNGTGATS